ncbi:hypothetical protein evm_000922 [Chilo suppressalis]|nr:hypothetical protein evm_000922 [Chilo suppressalis]
MVYTKAISDEVFFEQDKPYDVVNIRVPEALWRRAYQPTPVLKSPVTIVVPIHVAQDDENVVEDTDYEEAAEVGSVGESTTVSNQEILHDPVGTDATVAADVTQRPIADEITTPIPGQVNGTLFRFPCSCVDGQCGCCTGSILERIRTKACGNITFIPEDFVFDVRLSVNNNTVVRRRVSASDPPPICFNPRRAPFVEVCAEISNIRIRNRNAFACLDINADIAGFPIYSASFRCFGLGTSGVQTGLKPKPISSGPAPVSLYGNNNDDDDDDGGFIENAADALGVGDGIFGGGSDSDGGGPLDEIGDAVGDLFGDGRKF